MNKILFSLLGFLNFLNVFPMENEICDIISGFDGKIGICALNIKTKKEITHNADQFFPMASVRKIVLASYVFDQIEKDELDFEEVIELSKKDIALGTGVIKNQFTDSEVNKYTIKQLIEYMLCDTDNTAADYLMKILGGHEAIDLWLIENQIEDIYFRTDINTWLINQAVKTMGFKITQNIILNNILVPQSLKDLAANYQAIQLLKESLNPEPTSIDFSDETTNIAKPSAINKFLFDCYTGKAPGFENKEHHEFFLQCLRNCKTGKNRIPKYLNKNIIFHKTGSGIIGICNDAAIIESDKKFPVVLTIFIKDSIEPIDKLEEVIAKMARCVYESL